MRGFCCPRCGAKEVHPDGDKVLIRAYKFSNAQGLWSQCLVCAGGYDKNFVWHGENFNRTKGWFCTC